MVCLKEFLRYFSEKAEYHKILQSEQLVIQRANDSQMVLMKQFQFKKNSARLACHLLLMEW
jgi:hypothetical protein